LMVKPDEENYISAFWCRAVATTRH